MIASFHDGTCHDFMLQKVIFLEVGISGMVVTIAISFVTFSPLRNMYGGLMSHLLDTTLRA